MIGNHAIRWRAVGTIVNAKAQQAQAGLGLRRARVIMQPTAGDLALDARPVSHMKPARPTHRSWIFHVYFLALCATTAPAVTWGGLGTSAARFCLTQPDACFVDSSASSWLSKIDVETMTPLPASTK